MQDEKFTHLAAYPAPIDAGKEKRPEKVLVAGTDVGLFERTAIRAWVC